MKIIVDVDVMDMQIRAAKPELQTFMPHSDLEKVIFVENSPIERLNDRVWGHLRGKALRTAEHIVDRYGAINISGLYGSVEIDEGDFVQDG